MAFVSCPENVPEGSEVRQVLNNVADLLDRMMIDAILQSKQILDMDESSVEWLAYSTHDWKVAGSNLVRY